MLGARGRCAAAARRGCAAAQARHGAVSANNLAAHQYGMRHGPGTQKMPSPHNCFLDSDGRYRTDPRKDLQPGQRMEGKTIAIVLSGCGVYDGSEIQEVVFAFASIHKRGGTFQCFAPDQPQMHVIDHTKGEETSEVRNVLRESARVARGAVKPLSELSASDFDALVVPGGFGAAKNLSSFATQGAEMVVNADLARVIHEFHNVKKPLGFCCIAPVIAAKVLNPVYKDHKIKLTVGGDQEGEEWPYAGAAAAIDAMGAEHVTRDGKGVLIDAHHRVASSAAYMCGTSRVDVVQESVDGMIGGVAALMTRMAV